MNESETIQATQPKAKLSPKKAKAAKKPSKTKAASANKAGHDVGQLARILRPGAAAPPSSLTVTMPANNHKIRISRALQGCIEWLAEHILKSSFSR